MASGKKPLSIFHVTPTVFIIPVDKPSVNSLMYFAEIWPCLKSPLYLLAVTKKRLSMNNFVFEICAVGIVGKGPRGPNYGTSQNPSFHLMETDQGIYKAATFPVRICIEASLAALFSAVASLCIICLLHSSTT